MEDNMIKIHDLVLADPEIAVCSEIAVGMSCLKYYFCSVDETWIHWYTSATKEQSK